MKKEYKEFPEYIKSIVDRLSNSKGDREEDIKDLQNLVLLAYGIGYLDKTIE